MGVEYYALSDTKKQAYDLGKFSGAYDYLGEFRAAGNDTGLMKIALADLAADFQKEYLLEEALLNRIAKALAKMGVERIWNDSSDDVDEIAEYILVGSRYPGVKIEIGERVGDLYGYFNVDKVPSQSFLDSMPSMVPRFEIFSNPTISLADIKARRFQV